MPPFIIVPTDDSALEFRSTLEGILRHYEANDLSEYDFYDVELRKLIFKPIGKSARLVLANVIEIIDVSAIRAKILRFVKDHFPSEKVSEADFQSGMRVLAKKYSAGR